MSLESGTTLQNRYRIAEMMGKGGFGAVYRAWDLNLKRTCAIKENPDTSESAYRHFEREALLLANLKHPNLPSVIDHFSLPRQGQYLVMEYIEGHDLESLIDEAGGPLPIDKALEWVDQVCDALEYLHSQETPIIHRDIKPANILVNARGQAILVDFGIAKEYETGRATKTGARAVTPGYSPLEQYGLGNTDARTDIYALGATLYNLLTGLQPLESVQRNLGQTLPLLRTLNPNISPTLESVILITMELLPEKRFQSISELRNALQTAKMKQREVQQVSEAEFLQPIQDQSSGKQRSYTWIWVGAIMLALAVIAVALGISSSQGGSTRPPTSTSAPATAQPATAVQEVLQPTLTYTTIPPSATPFASPTPIFYQVQEGDTLWGIAIKYNVDLQALISANNLDPGNPIINVGDTLMIPTPP